MEINVTARYRTIGQIGVADGHVALLHELNAVATGIKKASPLHLQGDAEAVTGNAGNVSLGAADAISRGLHFRGNGIADTVRMEDPSKGATLLGRQLYGDAEQAFPANLPPLVETVFRRKVIR